MFNFFRIPVTKKLVDDTDAKKLRERQEQTKQQYRPEQGWLDSKENAVNAR